MGAPMKMNAEMDTPVPLRKQHTGMRYGLNERKVTAHADRSRQLCGVEAEAPAAVDALVVVKNLGVDGFAQGSADSTTRSSARHGSQ